MVARIKGVVPESYLSGPNRKPGHWNGEEESPSERRFESQYNGTVRPIKYEV